jgi:hypothetical protein
MVDVTQIEQALHQSLPSEQQRLAPQLAQILAAAANGAISGEEARAQVAALPDSDTIGQALISFGSAQTGDVQFGNIAGRDMINLFLSIIPQPARAQLQFYGDYTLPAIYIERSELFSRARSRLLADSPVTGSSTIGALWRPLALHGMGGIGKTVLARALCEDPTIRASFPDGIFWITLGKTPDLIRPLRDMIEQFGGIVSSMAATARSLKAQLAGLLEHKRCLIVADDVWSKETAEILRFGGRGCRLLVTTRDAALVEGIGAVILPVPVMEPFQARTVLRRWADGALDQVADQVLDRIVTELGALPLALKLAGPQLRRKDPQPWLAEFDMRKLRDRRPDNSPHDSLSWTFQLSLEGLSAEHQRLYCSLAVFRAGEATPEVGVAQLWKGLAGIDQGETSDLIDDLADRALLDRIIDANKRSIQLHDLLHDFITIELGPDQRLAAHERMLAAYRPEQGHWSDIPDDGYIYDHLTYHLREVDDGPGLARLFDNPSWLEARHAQRGSTYDGVAEDLTEAIATVKEHSFWQIDTGKPLTAATALFRLLLIQASLRTQATVQEPELLARAVATAVLTPARALSVVRHVSGPLRRVEHCVALLALSDTIESVRPALEKIALASLEELRDAEVRAFLLGDLVRFVQSPARERLIGEALELASGAIKPTSRIELMRKLVAWLADPLRRVVAEELLQAIRALEPRDRARALEPAIAVLPADLLGSLDADITALPDPYERGRLWRAIALARVSEERTLPLMYALGEAYKVTDPHEQAMLLVGLAPHLGQGRRAMALTTGLRIAPAITDTYDRAQILQAIAAQLPEPARSDTFNQALQLIGAACVVVRPDELIESIVPHLAADQCDRIVQEALDFIKSVQHAGRRAMGLSYAAPLLNEDQQLQALALIPADNLEARQQAMVALAPYLSPAAVTRALEVAADFPVSEVCAFFLAELGPYIRQQDLPYVVRIASDCADTIKQPRTRAEVRRKIAELMPERYRGRLLSDALFDVLFDDNNRWRIYPFVLEIADQLDGQALAHVFDVFGDGQYLGPMPHLWHRLARRLPEPQRSAQIERVLQAASRIDDSAARVELLAALAEDLPQPRQSAVALNALAMALQIEQPLARARAAIMLLPSLPDAERDMAISEILLVIATEQPSPQLAHLVDGMLEHPLLVEPARLLSTIKSITHPATRARLLQRVASHLPEPERAQVVEAIRRAVAEEPSLTVQLELLGELLPIFSETIPPALLEEPLRRAMALGNSYQRAEALRKLALLLPASERQPILAAILHSYAGRELQNISAYELSELAPLIGPETAAQALASARGLTTPMERAKALTALAAVLQAPAYKGLKGEALQELKAIIDEEQRAEALIGLAPQLTGELFDEALTLVHFFSHHEIRIAMLGTLAKPAEVQGLTQEEQARRCISAIAYDIGLIQHEFLLVAQAAALPTTLVLTPDLASYIAEHTGTICTKWKWL